MNRLLALVLVAPIMAACGGGGGGSTEAPLNRTPQDAMLEKLQLATMELKGGDTDNLYVSFDKVCEPNWVDDIGSADQTQSTFRMWVVCEKDPKMYYITFDSTSMKPLRVEF